MLRSTDRILVTHVGSLPRNETLSDLLIRQEAGEAIDTAAFEREVEAATAGVIREQVRAGMNIVRVTTGNNPGSRSRPMCRAACAVLAASRTALRRGTNSISRAMCGRWRSVSRIRHVPSTRRPRCRKSVTSTVHPIENDATRLKRLGRDFLEGFITAPSPGIVATTMLNQHYDTHEAYLTAQK